MMNTLFSFPFYKYNFTEHFYYMVNRIRKNDPHRLNEGHGSKFHVGSWVIQTLEDQRTYWLKHEYNNKDEDNSPKTLNDKNHQASSQKFK